MVESADIEIDNDNQHFGTISNQTMSQCEDSSLPGCYAMSNDEYSVHSNMLFSILQVQELQTHFLHQMQMSLVLLF